MRKRNERGITLIALVVTIIVLIILAAVSINLVLGDNGIITKADEARREQKIVKIKEEIQLDIMAKQAGNSGNISEEELKTILETKGTLSEEENIFDRILTTTEGSYEIKVSDIYNGKFGESSVIDGITAADIEMDASYIGKYVNYGGEETFKGVGWRIFNAENGKIQLIADNYIYLDVMPDRKNIRKGTAEYEFLGSDYCVNAIGSRNELMKYLNTTSIWSDFVVVTGAKATGGPTIEQFAKSYNRTHGESYEGTVKEIFIAKNENMRDGLDGYYIGTSQDSMKDFLYGLDKTEMENLYVIDNNRNASAYWLASPNSLNYEKVYYVNCIGYVSYDTYSYANGYGLRPLVILPTAAILVEQANGTFDIVLGENVEIEEDVEPEEEEDIEIEEGDGILEEITATNIEIDASYIGKYVNYGGEETFKGVKWRIFNAENGQIQLIADTYVDLSEEKLPMNVKIDSTKYRVYSTNSRGLVINYINKTSNWKNFERHGATVTGSPTIEQFAKSYNRTHGESYEGTVKEIFIAKSEVMSDGLEGYYVGISENPTTTIIAGLNIKEMKSLYVINDTTNAFGYWLGSPSAKDFQQVINVDYVGYLEYSIKGNSGLGLRPLATLPTGITLVEQENGTYNIK